MIVRRFSFPTVALVIQTAFVLIFAFVAEYHESADPIKGNSNHYDHQEMYPHFQDVHVMIFIGFGFLMTFLKRYGYTAVGINMFLACICIQWSFIVRGLLYKEEGDSKFSVRVYDMLASDFAAATVLISFGAVLGKASPLQLLVMAMFEVVASQGNAYVCHEKLHAVDVGESMYIHAFGAYFGIAVSVVLYKKTLHENKKQEAVYHSDLFSLIGTMFLWIYWPSFNGGGASGDEQQRAILNTYFSLAACVIVTFALAALYNREGKFNVEYIQNATLAGGVAVGTTANMPLQPWGALLMGCVAGLVSVTGFRFLTRQKFDVLAEKLRISDTCGVNNLHGMPGVLAGIAGAVLATLSTEAKWGKSLYEIFPEMIPKDNTTAYVDLLAKYPDVITHAGKGRTPHEQGGYQMLALVITLVWAIASGVITGYIMRLPFLDNPDPDNFFDDANFWLVPEGIPDEEEEHPEQDQENSHELKKDPKHVYQQSVADDSNGTTVNVHL